MKSTLLTLVSLACLNASSVAEDMLDKTVTYIPFNVVVGETAFSAGRYSISRVGGNPGALVLRNAERQVSAIFLPSSVETGS